MPPGSFWRGFLLCTERPPMFCCKNLNGQSTILAARLPPVGVGRGKGRREGPRGRRRGPSAHLAQAWRSTRAQHEGKRQGRARPAGPGARDTISLEGARRPPGGHQATTRQGQGPGPVHPFAQTRPTCAILCTTLSCINAKNFRPPAAPCSIFFSTPRAKP